MTRTLSDRLFQVAPASVVRPGTMHETVPDLQRILALPRRKPVNCDIDPVTKRYVPATQALIEVETAKFSRGPRVSCACRPRRVQLGFDGVLTISRILPPEDLPEAPIRVTRGEFLADQKTIGDVNTVRTVAAMQPGGDVMLPAADGEIGHPCITTLNAPQSWFLREAGQLGGAVGFLGVGSGKSIAFLLAPLLFPDSRLAVLLIEPKQRHHYRSQYLRLREHFRVSSIVSELEIPGNIVVGTPPLHLVSYSVLSRTSNSDLLDRLDPDTLLLDEAHRACGTSAINRRVKRFMASRIRRREEAMHRGETVRARAVRLLDGSGTLEVKSINDTQMLCAFSLGTGSPLPLDPNEAEAWSNVIDDSYQPDRKSATAKKLYKAFGNGVVPDDGVLFVDPEPELRRGFQKWRTETPGIISASASDINASIYITEHEVPTMPQVVRDALIRVRADWVRPDGEEFTEKMEQVACARNIACGFYTYWAFPKHPCSCKSDAVGPERCDQCQLIEKWYAKRKLYTKASRSLVLRGETELDSDQLCEDAAVRGWKNAEQKLEMYCHTCLHRQQRLVAWPCRVGTEEEKHLPAWREPSWPAWAEIEHQVEYEERVRWLGHDLPEAKDPNTHPGYFLARSVAEWARTNKGVVWFQSTPLGRKIAELSGLPYFNGGPGGEQRLRAEKGDRSIICSIPAHGAGTDGLQNIFHTQLIAEPPASNATARGIEQVLGRLHRRGQKKDEIYTSMCLHATEMKDALRQAIQQAEFNHTMSAILPKILLADIEVDEL